MFFFKLKLWLLIVIVGFIFPCGFAAEQQYVRIGVLALRGKDTCLKLWEPTAAFLTSNIPEYKFKIVPLAYSEIIDSVRNRKVDFILVNSSIYVTLEMEYNVSRIASMEKSYNGNYYNEYGGIIFCLRSNKSIDKLADLKGKSFMASDETSFGGWQIAWRLLQQNNINPYRDFSSVKFGGTNDAVVMAVKAGNADAGTVTTGILESMIREGRVSLEDFKIIHRVEYPARRFPLLCSTQLYPEWPFAELAHIPHGLGEKVMVALTRMKPEDAAAVAAGIAGWSEPLNYSPVNECLKELRIGPYEVYGQITFAAFWKEYRLWVVFGFIFIIMIMFFLIYVSSVNYRMRKSAMRIEQELAERKQIEDKLRYSEDIYRSLIESIPDLVWRKSPDGLYISCNPAFERLFGMKKADIVGKSNYDFFDKVQADFFRSYDDKVMETDKACINEEWLTFADSGDRKLFEVIKTPMHNAAGEIIGVLGIARDITERKLAQNALEEASAQEAEQRGRALMAGSVLHDIGNAMTGVGTLAIKHLGDTGWPEIKSMSMLRKMFSNPSEALEQALGKEKITKLQEFLAKLEESLSERKNTILETSQKMANLVSHINDVLSLQRIYAGGSKALSSNVLLKQLTDDAVAMLAASLQKRNIAVVFNVEQDIQEIKVDKTRIIQVLINLLKNAAESFDIAGRTENRRIEIAIRQESNQQVMEITDNAAGFEPAMTDKFFKNGFSTKNRSSGIGLYQCASIIKSHGGKIELSSPGQEQGATAKIILPLEIAT